MTSEDRNEVERLRMMVEVAVDGFYSGMLGKETTSLTLRGRCMHFKSGALGCCLKRVIRFCLEKNPVQGDVVPCSEKCTPPFNRKMIFDGRDWRRE